MAATKSLGALSALARAAAALPAFAGAAGALHAQTVDPAQRVERPSFDISYGNYSESGTRMDVATAQATFTVPVASGWQVAGNFIRDVTSGASPFAYVPVGGGKYRALVQAGASIRDTRDVIDGTVKFFGTNGTVAVNLGQSKEDDYRSYFTSVDADRYFNDKNTVLKLGVAYADDKAWNSEGASEIYKRHPVYQDRNKLDLKVGVSQLLDRNSVLSGTIIREHSWGSLNEPYKAAMLPPYTYFYVRDARPDTRTVWSGTGRYSRFVPGLKGALHLVYRRAEDSWKADSDTFSLGWAQKVGSRLTLTPSARYYRQHAASFYRISLLTKPADGLVSSDYRLARFETFNVGMQASLRASEKLYVTGRYQHGNRKDRMIWASGGAGYEVDNFRSNLFAVELNGGF